MITKSKDKLPAPKEAPVLIAIVQALNKRGLICNLGKISENTFNIEVRIKNIRPWIILHIRKDAFISWCSMYVSIAQPDCLDIVAKRVKYCLNTYTKWEKCTPNCQYFYESWLHGS